MKGYPRLSETFIAHEIRALEQRGLDIRIISLRHPTDRRAHPVHEAIKAPVSYLPEYLYQEPVRLLLGWRSARAKPGYRQARKIWLRDLIRDPTPNRVRRFGQAVVLAAELPSDVRRLHAHFIHTPASVTRYASLILGLPWTCSAHARDIWTSRDWEKREKLAECRWAVTCTAANREHLRALAPSPERVELVYHGLDLESFRSPPGKRSRRDGSDPDDPVRLLSVGRAVEKKGYDDLIDALGKLPPGLCWHFVHIGGGPLLSRLKARAAARGVARRITWRGAMPQNDVLTSYRNADVFVLASRIAKDGDRDGLPNVLMEAQGQGLPCLATRLSAIPELIEDERTGILVPARDTAALSTAMQRLIQDPGLRERLGEAGGRVVRERFCFTEGIDRLARKFGLGEGATGTSDCPAST